MQKLRYQDHATFPYGRHVSDRAGSAIAAISIWPYTLVMDSLGRLDLESPNWMADSLSQVAGSLAQVVVLPRDLDRSRGRMGTLEAVHLVGAATLKGVLRLGSPT